MPVVAAAEFIRPVLLAQAALAVAALVAQMAQMEQREQPILVLAVAVRDTWVRLAVMVAQA